MFSPWVHQNEYTLRRPTQLTHQSGISRTQWTQHSCHQEEPPPVLLWRHDKGALELYRTESKWCSLHIEQYQARSLDDPGPGEYGVCHPRHPGTGAVTHHTHQLIWGSNTEKRTCTAHVHCFPQWLPPCVMCERVRMVGIRCRQAAITAGPGCDTDNLVSIISQTLSRPQLSSSPGMAITTRDTNWVPNIF